MSIYWIPRHYIANSCAQEPNALKGFVLDFGCGSKPYAKYFTHATEYIGLEYDKNLETGSSYHKNGVIYYDGRSILLADNSVDVIVSFQVLEHVQHLSLTLRELRRVAKPGASFLLTVPLLWPEHKTPHDYRRFTRWGAKRMLFNASLMPVKLEPLGSIYDVAIVFILDYLNTHANPALRRLARLFAPALNSVS